jgi:hypothetical protein
LKKYGIPTDCDVSEKADQVLLLLLLLLLLPILTPSQYPPLTAKSKTGSTLQRVHHYP